MLNHKNKRRQHKDDEEDDIINNDLYQICKKLLDSIDSIIRVVLIDEKKSILINLTKLSYGFTDIDKIVFREYYNAILDSDIYELIPNEIEDQKFIATNCGSIVLIINHVGELNEIVRMGIKSTCRQIYFSIPYIT